MQSGGLNQGNITILNSNPNTGVPTTGSTVVAQLDGKYDTASIQVFGTYTGALTVQVQLDSTNWVNLTGATSLTNAGTGAQTANITSGTQGVWQLDISGFTGVRVTALAAVTGSAAVTIIPGVGSGIIGIDTPVFIGGLPNGTNHSLLAAATTNATSVKTSAGNVMELTLTNYAAAARFFKFYDKASAPTVGTDSPIFVVALPANSQAQFEFGNLGKRFGTGIAYAMTTAQAIADTGALTAGDVRVHFTYV